MKVDKNLKSKRSNWEFDKQIVNKFESHVEKSVPFYNISHEIVLGLSDYFLKKKVGFMILVAQLVFNS